ncbi:hypothetical protein M885DRAFT_509924 [Pelagophyceae sp. CCMP2097]|nr:hypothetical protein M885DRAFT_509924 [Pelagophyceae sp. CCMP2097]
MRFCLFCCLLGGIGGFRSPSRSAARPQTLRRAEIPEPAYWTQYPRGKALLDEVAATLSHSFVSEKHRRLRVQLGRRDLDFLSAAAQAPRKRTGDQEMNIMRPLDAAPRAPTADSTLAAVAEIAARWDHGPVVALVSTQAAVARLELLASLRRPGNPYFSASTLRQASRNADMALESGTLVIVVEPDSNVANENPISQLQAFALRMRQFPASALVLLNPRLSIPNPVAFNQLMSPLLLTDFKLCFAAIADAYEVSHATQQSGVAIYHKRPLDRWRIFERSADEYSLVATTIHWPSDSELRAVYCAANAIDNAPFT